MIEILINITILLTGIAAGIFITIVILRQRASNETAADLKETPKHEELSPLRSLENLKEELSKPLKTEEKEEEERKQEGSQEGDSPLPESPVFSVSELYKLANKMDAFFNDSAHPRDLLESPDFIHGVDLLCLPASSDDVLFEYSTGDNALIACMALEALHRREPGETIIDQLISYVGDTYMWPIFFVLRIIGNKNEKPLIGAILAQAKEWWGDNKMMTQMITSFITERLKEGEKPEFGSILDAFTDEDINRVRTFLKALKHPGIELLPEELDRHTFTQLDTEFLNTIGTVWTDEKETGFVFEHEQFRDSLNQVEETLLHKPSRSVLLFGEPGVGKTILIKILAKRLREKSYRVFESRAADILAGQVYIGELEERIRGLIKNLDNRRSVIWFIPNFHELFYAGRHKYSPTSVLDLIVPFIDNGTLTIIGETHPTAYERLILDNKRIQTLFEAVRIEPLNDTKTLELARQWAAHEAGPTKEKSFLDDRTLQEASHLTKQFLSNKAAPGNLVNFLKQTRRRLMVNTDIAITVTTDDLLTTLSNQTGLPRSILDDREGLDLDGLRNLFQERVRGQAEVVECLIERIAMIKSGLTDPTRPLGVFLFAGPTGTGKTEIAKTLSEYLFGSPERMIRLDMSEFQTPESLDRILGETEEKGYSQAMVNQVRKQPFSVILLDEIEKAHPNVWDIFLQVFDDGRLTDRNGNTADFRHTIIILTSNLGAQIEIEGGGIGFSSSASAFSLRGIEKSIIETFRPEFINRIDRVVIFRPLNRTVMRDILYTELSNILERRGLRSREWAVEWDSSAIDFLLQKGFTSDLGARPLKRAIERYLLSPLAMTIVNHQVPEGDQFLFIRSDGERITVEFIDPDATGEKNEKTGTEPDSESAGKTEGSRLKSLVLEARGTRDDLELLQASYTDLKSRITSEIWQTRKEQSLETTSSPGFWESPNRYSVLGEVEYMDRIESGLNTAGALLARVQGSTAETRTSFSPELLSRLARHIYLLNEAYASLEENIPKDAFLHIAVKPKTQKDALPAKTFARQLSSMYLEWAKKRRMKYTVLKEQDGGGMEPYTFIIAVSGFGAYSILKPESGLHVLETPKDGNDEKNFKRYNVHVQVIDQPESPLKRQETLLAQAEQTIASFDTGTSTIVRRYRRDPSPLVRDSVRKWRTGRLDRVIEGDFDLLD
ncbi:MAG: AAA domain-containing protein [bacterium]|nr:AAA domain-containing protein [bacterium]